MKYYINEELKRAFLSKTTILTSLLAIILMVIGMFDFGDLPFSWVPELSVMYLFVSGFIEGMSSYLGLLFPIITAMPFATTFISDSQCGLTKNLFFRLPRKDYLIIKFSLNALVGGVVLVIGPFVGLLIALVLKIIYQMPMIQEQTQTVEVFNSLGIYSPWIMIIIIFVNLFFCGVIFSTFALGLSVLIQKSYLTIVAPFGFLLFSGIVLNVINPNLYIVNIYDLTLMSSGVHWWFLYGLTYFIIGAVLFFVGGVKLEEKYI